MLHRNLKEEVARLREDIKEDFAGLNSRFSRLEGWFVHHLSRGAQSGGSGGAQSGGSGGAQSGDSGGASTASQVRAGEAVVRRVRALLEGSEVW